MSSGCGPSEWLWPMGRIGGDDRPPVPSLCPPSTASRPFRLSRRDARLEPVVSTSAAHSVREGRLGAPRFSSPHERGEGLRPMPHGGARLGLRTVGVASVRFAWSGLGRGRTGWIESGARCSKWATRIRPGRALDVAHRLRRFEPGAWRVFDVRAFLRRRLRQAPLRSASPAQTKAPGRRSTRKASAGRVRAMGQRSAGRSGRRRNNARRFGGLVRSEGGRNAPVKVFALTTRPVSPRFFPLPASRVVRETCPGGVAVWWETAESKNVSI